MVDENGYHAKTFFEPAPADKTVVYNACDDDTSAKPSSKDSGSPHAKVVLQEVELVGGADGFAFNKKFKARAKVEVKDKNTGKRVTFRLFCRYNKKEYEIKPGMKE